MASASRQVQPSPPEFRTEAIRLARSRGNSHRQSADELGITSERLRWWLKPADREEAERSDGLPSDEQEERRRLRRETRMLREERERVNQAAAVFARQPDSIR